MGAFKLPGDYKPYENEERDLDLGLSQVYTTTTNTTTSLIIIELSIGEY